MEISNVSCSTRVGYPSEWDLTEYTECVVSNSRTQSQSEFAVVGVGQMLVNPFC